MIPVQPLPLAPAPDHERAMDRLLQQIATKKAELDRLRSLKPRGLGNQAAMS